MMFGLVSDDEVDRLGYFFQKRVWGLPDSTSNEAMQRTAMEPPLSTTLKAHAWKTLGKIVGQLDPATKLTHLDQRFVEEGSALPHGQSHKDEWVW